MEEALWKIVTERYRTPSELARYRQRADDGLRAWEEVIRTRFHLPPGRVLDIGCGGGREALALVALGYTVVAIDCSPEQLASAQALGTARHVVLALCQTDGRTLPFADEVFDAILLWSQVLGNVPGARTRHRLLQECRRVLRPGQCLSFSVHDRGRTEALAREQNLILSGEMGTFEDGDFLLADAPANPCYWHYFTREELEELCQAAGLKLLACEVASTLRAGSPDNLWVVVCQREAEAAHTA